ASSPSFSSRRRSRSTCQSIRGAASRGYSLPCWSRASSPSARSSSLSPRDDVLRPAPREDGRPVRASETVAGPPPSRRHATFLVAACAKQRFPIWTVRVVSDALWFAAAAVNQCFVLTESLNMPGWRDARFCSATFCRPSVGVLNCHFLPDVPCGGSGPTDWLAMVGRALSPGDTGAAPRGEAARGVAHFGGGFPAPLVGVALSFGLGLTTR